MKKIMGIIAVGVCAILSGCSTAGPFVTNISSDGRGNLIIEKNMARFNAFTGVLSLGEQPITSSIKFVPDNLTNEKQEPSTVKHGVENL